MKPVLPVTHVTAAAILTVALCAPAPGLAQPKEPVTPRARTAAVAHLKQYYEIPDFLIGETFARYLTDFFLAGLTRSGSNRQ